MKKNIYRIILILGLIILTACNASEYENLSDSFESNIQKSSSNENNTDNNINVGIEEYEVGQEKTQISYEYSNQYIERRYYSPDGREYVLEKIDGLADFEGSYTNYLYLGSSLDEVGILYQPYIRKSLSLNSIIWVDNSSFIVGGIYIYDIEKKGIKEYILKEVLDSSYLLNYDLNFEKTKIAYSIIDENDFKGKIFIYDIETGETKKIHEYEKEFTSIVNLNIVWDINENIYFDITNTGEEYQVYKYEKSSEEIYSFYENARMLNMSNENRFIVIADIFNRNVVIFDTIQDKTFTIDYTLDLVRLDETSFAYIPLFDSGVLLLVELDGGNLEVIESIELKNIQCDDYNVENLRYENKRILLDIVKYKDNQTKDIVIESKTYNVNVGKNFSQFDD